MHPVYSSWLHSVTIVQCFIMFTIFQVTMTFHRDDDMTVVDEEDSVVPMTEVYVNVTSTPNTPVIVSVFDKSLSLLAGSCDIGKQSSVSPYSNCAKDNKPLNESRHTVHLYHSSSSPSVPTPPLPSPPFPTLPLSCRCVGGLTPSCLAPSPTLTTAVLLKHAHSAALISARSRRRWTSTGSSM